MSSFQPWSREEIDWARECIHAGDSLEEIAEAAGRTVEDVRAQLGSGRSLTERQREVLSLYLAGATFEAIADELGMVGRNRRKAPATMITSLRRRGFSIPHRISVEGEART